MRNLLLTLMLFAIAGCGSDEKTVNERRDVVAVWKHEPNVYSVTVQHNKQLTDIQFNAYNGRRSIRLVADVPTGSNMWYEARYVQGGLWISSGYSSVIIHIHSINDINDGGWNHGKFGKGMTERVE